MSHRQKLAWVCLLIEVILVVIFMTLNGFSKLNQRYGMALLFSLLPPFLLALCLNFKIKFWSWLSLPVIQLFYLALVVGLGLSYRL